MSSNQYGRLLSRKVYIALKIYLKAARCQAEPLLTGG